MHILLDEIHKILVTLDNFVAVIMRKRQFAMNVRMPSVSAGPARTNAWQLVQATVR